MKSFIISKRDHHTVIACLLMFSLALTILSTTVTSVISAAATPRKIPIYSVARDDKKAFHISNFMRFLVFICQKVS